MPYTGMIISTRRAGSSGRVASSRRLADQRRVTDYGRRLRRRKNARMIPEQFDVSDQRTLDEVVRWLMQLGCIPSFCTACYREGRTGDRFEELNARAVRIQNFAVIRTR